MATLRLQDVKPVAARPGADLYGCAYSADGASVLSAGWDGFLRLWEAATGDEVNALQVGAKPLSCCALSPDGRWWLGGTIEGMLSAYDATTLAPTFSQSMHTRPISAIRFGPDGEQAATASWDRQVTLRKFGKDRETRVLTGHKDIVAGCRFTGDGGQLLSWSYDATVRVWDVASAQEAAVLQGHADRVTAADPSPDAGWAVSGGRDGEVRLWDLSIDACARAVRRPAEVRGCFFLLDGASIVVVDASGGVALLSVPNLEIEAQLQVDANPLSADLAPSGTVLALACEDGRMRFVTLDGLEDSTLVVTAGRRTHPTRGMLGRLLGRPPFTHTYEYTCPVCRRSGQASVLPTQPFRCSGCRRKLRVSGHVRQLQEV
jgi:WD40 repeat protein